MLKLYYFSRGQIYKYFRCAAPEIIIHWTSSTTIAGALHLFCSGFAKQNPKIVLMWTGQCCEVLILPSNFSAALRFIAHAMQLKIKVQSLLNRFQIFSTIKRQRRENICSPCHAI